MPWLPRRLIAAAASITLATYILAMGISLLLLFSTSIGRDLFNHEGTLVIGAFMIPFRTPIRINMLVSFLATFALYAVCFFVAAKTKGGLVATLKGGPRESIQRIPNWLVVMPLASSGLLLAMLVITGVQNLLGIPTGSLPPLEPYQMLYALAYSPILEETMFRFTVLGAIVAVRTIWNSSVFSSLGGSLSPARLVLLSLLLPDRAKAEAGLPSITRDGGRGIHWGEWLFVIITSTSFGLAHILTNSGWQVGKVLTAALAGLALGVVFLAYGAYASILLHWFFNFYFEVFSLGSSLIGGIFRVLPGLIGLFTISVGVLGIAVAVILLVSRKPTAKATPYMAPDSSPLLV